MTGLLAHPFGIGPDGHCRTVEPDSDEHYQQLLTVAVTTRPGEREMCLPYGLPDPAFRGVEPEDVQAVVDDFGPPVTIAAVDVRTVSDTEQIANLVWDYKTAGELAGVDSGVEV